MLFEIPLLAGLTMIHNSQRSLTNEASPDLNINLMSVLRQRKIDMMEIKLIKKIRQKFN